MPIVNNYCCVRAFISQTDDTSLGTNAVKPTGTGQLDGFATDTVPLAALSQAQLTAMNEPGDPDHTYVSTMPADYVCLFLLSAAQAS